MSRNKNKEKVEILLDKVKDKDILDYMNKHATTRAGFVRQVLKEYVQSKNTPLQQKSVIEEADNVVSAPSIIQKEKKIEAKRSIPKQSAKLNFGQSFRASDLFNNDTGEE